MSFRIKPFPSRVSFPSLAASPSFSEEAEYTQGFRPVKALGSKFSIRLESPEQDHGITPPSPPGSATGAVFRRA
jgi:hypothetical protein